MSRPKDQHKAKPRQIIGILADLVSRNANYLLNVGPDADGCIPAPAVRNLKTVGRWLRVNGTAKRDIDFNPNTYSAADF